MRSSLSHLLLYVASAYVGSFCFAHIFCHTIVLSILPTYLPIPWRKYGLANFFLGGRGGGGGLFFFVVYGGGGGGALLILSFFFFEDTLLLGVTMLPIVYLWKTGLEKSALQSETKLYEQKD